MKTDTALQRHAHTRGTELIKVFVRTHNNNMYTAATEYL